MKNKEPTTNENYNTGSMQEADNQWDMSGIEWGSETASNSPDDEEPIEADFEVAPLSETEMTEESMLEPEKKLTLEEIRQRHVEYLKGTYAPTQEEWLRIMEDDGFYDSSEYLTFRKQELDEFAGKHSEIYAPPDENINRATKPFIDLIRSDIDGLLNTMDGIEKGELTHDNIYRVIGFFAEKFGVADVPDLELVYDTDNDGPGSRRTTMGSYSLGSNTVSIMPSRISSAAKMVDTVAHEVWHAHQRHHGDNNNNYELNFTNYYDSSIDYDAYRNQLVEKEAFTVGEAVGVMYRGVILDKDPRRVAELNDKYRDWLDGEYDPYETDDGIDVAYLVLAHRKYVEYNKLSNVLKRFFRREKK